MVTLRNKLRVLLMDLLCVIPKYIKTESLGLHLIHMGKRTLCFQSLGENKTILAFPNQTDSTTIHLSLLCSRMCNPEKAVSWDD